MRAVAAIARVAAATIAAVSLLAVGASSAGAVVIDEHQLGQSSVPYNPVDQSGYYGVNLVQNPQIPLGTPSPSIPKVVSPAPCSDPALPHDLVLPFDGICSHRGNVMHRNETLTLTWDPDRRYFETTRNYVDQFLSDVAAGNGTLTSPYADTTQYTDSSGRAGNVSLFDGGCVDFGSVGGATCRLANGAGTAAGHDYPTANCRATGNNQFEEFSNGGFGSGSNDVCVTDAQVRAEVSAVLSEDGVLGHTTPGFTPLVMVLTPSGVVDCIDAQSQLCSGNSSAPARFCSYHAQLTVAGKQVAYLVQPWTASWTTGNGCDEFGLAPIPNPVDTTQLAVDVGERLVSPLSQSHMAAITNPALNGWFALDGSEINDNGCVLLAGQLDVATVGTSSQNPYYLQREFNNAGVIETDPNALRCTPSILLTPAFVAPSAVNTGDLIQLDGSTSVSSLIIPRAGYSWNFGDGHTATGPSVEHSYRNAGTFRVSLTVTDRGGNSQTLSHTVSVLGKGSGRGGSGPTSPLRFRLQLQPQGLAGVLRSGIAVLVTTNSGAAGFAQVYISNADARRAGLATSRSGRVEIGVGTIAFVRNGTTLHLRLGSRVRSHLARVGHVTLTVRLVLLSPGGGHTAVDVAGHY